MVMWSPHQKQPANIRWDNTAVLQNTNKSEIRIRIRFIITFAITISCST